MGAAAAAALAFAPSGGRGMEWTGYLLALLFAGVSLALVASVLLGLPGTWLMLGLAVAVEVWDHFFHTAADPVTFGWPTLIAAGVLAGIGELLEAGAGAAGTKLGGGSSRGMLGAIVGGLIGAIVCTPLIPIPVLGTLIGALLGTFIGAWIGEAGSIRAEDPAATFKAASGAALGRLAGTLGKLMVAVVIWVLLVVAAFVP